MRNNASTDNYNATVSIIVPTCGRPMRLLALLKSLEKQRNPGPWELVIIDDSRQLEILTKLLAKLWPCAISLSGTSRVNGLNMESLSGIDAAGLKRVLLVQTSSPASGPGVARATGLQHAEGDIIVTLDDDMIASSELIRQARIFCQNGGCAGAGRAIQKGSGLAGAHGYRNTPRHRGWIQGRNLFIPTELAVYDRVSLEAAGGFPRDYPFACEDLALSDRLKSNGVKLEYAASVMAIHKPDSALHVALRRQFRYGWGHVRYWEKGGTRRRNSHARVIKGYVSAIKREYAQAIGMSMPVVAGRISIEILMRASYHLGAVIALIFRRFHQFRH